MVERADLLSRGTRRVGRFLVLDPRYLAPILVAWGLSLVIFLAENDLGSSFLFFALFIGMLWVATGRAYYLGLGAVLFGVRVVRLVEGDRARPVAGAELAQPVAPLAELRISDHPGLVCHRARAVCSEKAQARATRAPSPKRRPT